MVELTWEEEAVRQAVAAEEDFREVAEEDFREVAVDFRRDTILVAEDIRRDTILVAVDIRRDMVLVARDSDTVMGFIILLQGSIIPAMGCTVDT